MSAIEEGFVLIFRLLVVSLLSAASVASAAAQVAADKSSDSLPPFVPPQKWVDACARLHNYHCVFIWKANSKSQTNPSTAQPGEHDSTIIPSPKLPKIVIRLEPNDVTCYSMRTYRVTRDDPDSDSTRPAGYSTCLRGTRVQLWTSEDLPDTAAR
jgi:hypothetical protein